MSEEVITYACTSGTGGTGWTNKTYAYDTTSGTYAVPYINEMTYTRLPLYVYTTATGVGTITKVEVGVSGYSDQYYYWCYLSPTFSGSFYGESPSNRVPFTTSWDTYWFDVTSGVGTPPIFEGRGWENNDITYSNLSVFSEYENVFVKIGSYKAYIDQVYWRVTYSG